MRTRKESKERRGTYFLETTKGGASEGMEGK
jgi:hypothetical protein